MEKHDIIRPANFKDALAIYEVVRENPEEVLPRSLPDIMLHFERFLVYEREGEVLGAVSWQVLPILDIENPDFALEIISFSVKKDYQGQGIGRELMRKMLDHLVQFHPDRVLVLTFYPEFFSKYGFIETSKRALYPKIYLGCIGCTKYPSPLSCPEVAMEYRYKE